jgi:hypothetical protein
MTGNENNVLGKVEIKIFPGPETRFSIEQVGNSIFGRGRDLSDFYSV